MKAGSTPRRSLLYYLLFDSSLAPIFNFLGILALIAAFCLALYLLTEDFKRQSVINSGVKISATIEALDPIYHLPDGDFQYAAVACDIPQSYPKRYWALLEVKDRPWEIGQDVTGYALSRHVVLEPERRPEKQRFFWAGVLGLVGVVLILIALYLAARSQRLSHQGLKVDATISEVDQEGDWVLLDYEVEEQSLSIKVPWQGPIPAPGAVIALLVDPLKPTRFRRV